MQKPHHSPGFLKLAEASRSKIREISAQALKAMLTTQTQRGFILIDVREDHERILGYISGSIHIGRGIIERDIEIKVPMFDQKVILYCGGGYRSALAADHLQQMGYTNVLSLEGGYRHWCELNFPTTIPTDKEGTP